MATKINKHKVSIIVTCFNGSKVSKHMTMVCLDHIRKFTDEGDYELIVMDPTPKYPITDDYKTLLLDKKHNAKHMVLDKDIGYTACMNLGAREAKYPILVFLQNDVFVREGWLKDMLFYIKEGWEAVFPDQVPRHRSYITESYKRPHDHLDSMTGGRDAGCLMITKEAFDRTGGWDEELSLLAERDFYQRMGKGGVRWTDTNKVFITHIMAGTNMQLLVEDPKEYDKRMKADGDKLNG